MQALNAWLLGHDSGVLLQGPDADAPTPLLNGIVTHQQPSPGARAHRWDAVSVWVGQGPDAGVREPRRPLPPEDDLRAAVAPELTGEGD